ncbi:MAG: hypothetical protein IKZ58_00935 [Selenomonadaceae bacterium]|nr:hypothetical protein [Selenomonadaceae bacterium]
MIRKIFLLSLTLILFCQAALAKDKPAEIPLEDRVKILVEVSDITNFVELETDSRLQSMLIQNLAAQNIFNVMNTDENVFSLVTLGDKKSMADVGELLIFTPTADENFDIDAYKNFGASYVVRCKILGIGVEEITENYGRNGSIGIGIDIGRHRHSGFGIGIGTGIDLGGSRKRKVYCVAVQVQFINAETGKTLWRQNVVGQVNLKSNPSKGYDDANDEAYLKALQDVTKNISKHVTDYAQKFLVSKSQ